MSDPNRNYAQRLLEASRTHETGKPRWEKPPGFDVWANGLALKVRAA